jgi:hypothetical protein
VTVFVGDRHPLGHNLGHNFRRPTCQSDFLYGARLVSNSLADSGEAVGPDGSAQTATINLFTSLPFPSSENR